MVSIEIIGIYCILLLNFVWTLLLIRGSSQQIAISLSELNEALGDSLVDVIQDLGNVEIQQQDPIRMAIAQWIANNITKTTTTPEEKLNKLARGEGGKFV